MTSNINPNNIDGAYPVAGQDNNSQGFRTNFTNTATNFQYAANEITDLQNKAVLKSALSGTTLDNNMQGSPLSNAVLYNMGQLVNPLGTVTTVPINYELGSYQTVSSPNNSGPGTLHLSFSNWPAGGTYGVVRVQITILNIGYTVTLPSAVGYGATYTSLQYIIGRSASSQIITFTAPGTYVFEFSTSDGGSSIFIQDLTRGAANSPSA
jgi:hypothetical protein